MRGANGDASQNAQAAHRPMAAATAERNPVIMNISSGESHSGTRGTSGAWRIFRHCLHRKLTGREAMLRLSLSFPGPTSLPDQHRARELCLEVLRLNQRRACVKRGW
jgi:hypothetical protein